MEIEFDSAKRDATLSERGLDFADATKVFAGLTASTPDGRKDYGEPRIVTMGMLDERLVVLVWTPRGSTRRIISMRYAHEDEARRFGYAVG